MSVLQAVFLGIVQGLTEFIPVSSSGHLNLCEYFFKIDTGESQTFFNVCLHLGTLFAVCFVYYKDIIEILKDLVKIIPDTIHKNQSERPETRRLIYLVVISLLPLFVIFPFGHKIAEAFSTPLPIASALAVTAVMMFLLSATKAGKKTITKIKWVDALLIGIFQAIAITPGISRSGATIYAGMQTGMSRKLAVKFSFIMSIPTILAAVLLDAKDALSTGIDYSLLGAYLIGMITAALVGLFAIKVVNYIAEKNNFKVFGFYCITLSVIVLIASFF